MTRVRLIGVIGAAVVAATAACALSLAPDPRGGTGSGPAVRSFSLEHRGEVYVVMYAAWLEEPGGQPSLKGPMLIYNDRISRDVRVSLSRGSTVVELSSKGGASEEGECY